MAPPISIIKDLLTHTHSRECVASPSKPWRGLGLYLDSKALRKAWVRAYATSGYEAAYRYSAKQLERLYLNGRVYKPDWIASWYARSGDSEESLKWLKILSADNNGCTLVVERNQDFASLRSDPRFQQLVKRPR